MESIKYLEEFIISELKRLNFTLVPITQQLIESRLPEIMNFVNTIRKEGNNKYGWLPEKEEYFLKPMDRKFSYSFLIENEKSDILILSLVSVYDKIIHNHCTYTHLNYRSMGLAKLLIMSYCLKGMNDGYRTYGAWFPKINNGSIILHLRLGVTIQYMRNDVEIYANGDLLEMTNNAFRLYCKEINYNTTL